MFKNLLTILVLLTISVATYGQKTDAEPASAHQSHAKLKPRLGIGLGTFAYYGEIGNDNKGNNIGTANIAWRISLSNEVTSFLDVSIYSIFGRFSVNEYSSTNKANFQSEIRTTGLALRYNFNNFMHKKQYFQPWISVGIESFEFLSKTDLKDANGQDYHYWSDGTIRDVEEGVGDADNANFLYRDYVYETDLRELDLDGLGHYKDNSVSIPVGVGVQWNVTERFKAKFGTEMHFTFTDLIDNVSDAGEGERKGTSNNDRFLFSSVSLHYDLNLTPKKEDISEPLMIQDENGDYYSLNIDDDADMDGVNDFIDKCLGTPEGVKVDKDGCPIDSDKDGVPDYIDEEPNTSEIRAVNSEGIALTDEEFLEKYLFWTDSVQYKEGRWVEEYAKLESDPSHWSNVYSVKIGSDDDGLTQDEINLLLSLKDVKTVNENDQNVYLVGEYQHLPEAVKRKMELENEGIHGNVIEDVAGELADLSDVTAQIENSFSEFISEDSISTSDEVIYRIQIGAFKYTLSENVFDGIDDMIIVKGEDGLTRYMSGSYVDRKKAAQRKVSLLMDGFEGAFLTAYKSGKRISLAEAGLNVYESVPDLTYDVENNSIKRELISFRVQLGQFSDDLPTETLDTYLEIGNISPQKEKDGSIRYLSKTFSTYEEAQEFLKKAEEKGLEEIIVVGDFNGKIISADEAKKLNGTDGDQVLLNN